MSSKKVDKILETNDKSSINIPHIVVYIILLLASVSCFLISIFSHSNLVRDIFMSLSTSIFAGIVTAALFGISNIISEKKTRDEKIKNYYNGLVIDLRKIIDCILLNETRTDDFDDDFLTFYEKLASNNMCFNCKGLYKKVIVYVIHIENETLTLLRDADSINLSRNNHDRKILSQLATDSYTIRYFCKGKNEMDIIHKFHKIYENLKNIKIFSDYLEKEKKVFKKTYK